MELDILVKKNTSDIERLVDLVGTLTADMREYIVKQEILRSTVDRLSDSLDKYSDITQKQDIKLMLLDGINRNVEKLNASSDEFSKRFDRMDEISRLRTNVMESIGRHWWKIIIIMAPLLALLFETGAYLRNLPVVK